jgi:hypothetical protein
MTGTGTGTGTGTTRESFQFGLWFCSTVHRADSGPIKGINSVVTSVTGR